MDNINTKLEGGAIALSKLQKQDKDSECYRVEHGFISSCMRRSSEDISLHLSEIKRKYKKTINTHYNEETHNTPIRTSN